MWLSPNQMNSLLYWENPRDSGIICGSVLVCLLAVRYISLISVIGNLSLALVTATMSFRIYKSVLAAVNKTNEGHPFKQFLEVDVTLPADKVSSLSDSFFSKLNSILLKLKSILLVENTVESVKVRKMIDFSSSSFIWHFNATGIPKRWSSMKMPLPVALYETIVTLAWVGMFSAPRVYRDNQKQIDEAILPLKTKFDDLQGKLQAALPASIVGKKDE